MDFINNPRAIESLSMTIIEEHLPQLASLPLGKREIIKRVIHTTGDLGYGELVSIHPAAVTSGLKSLQAGQPVITDVNMVKTGINKNLLAKLDITIHCYINHPDVIAEAQNTGLTRAMVAMRRTAPKLNGGIAVIGNAPTALFTLLDMIQHQQTKPALVIGTPVGFVGAAESKELLTQYTVPFITVLGTKGGSTIAAAIVNALLNLAVNGRIT